MSIQFSSSNSTSFIDASTLSLPSGDWALFFGLRVGSITGSTTRMCFVSIGAASDTILGDASHITLGLQNTSGGNAYELNQLMVTGRDSASVSLGTRPVANYMGLTTERTVLSGFGLPGVGSGFVCLQKSGTEIQLWHVRAPGETAVLVHKAVAMGAWAGFSAQPLLFGCLNRTTKTAFTQISTAMQRFGRVAKALTAAQMEQIASGADPVALLTMNAPDGDLYWSFDGLSVVTNGATFNDAVQSQVATASGSGWSTPSTEVIPTSPTDSEVRLLRRTIYHTKTSPGAIRLAGTYRASGTVIDVQARVLNSGTQAVITDWTTVAAGVSGGVWSGDIGGITRQVLDLEINVRLVIDSASQTALTGFVAQAGVVLQVLGQSLPEYLRTDTAYTAGVPSSNLSSFVPSTVPPNTTTGSYSGAAQARFRRGPAPMYQYQIGYGEFQLATRVQAGASCRVLVCCDAMAGSPIGNYLNNTYLAFDRAVESITRTGAGIVLWEQGQSNQVMTGAEYQSALTTLYEALAEACGGVGAFEFGVSPLALSLDHNSSSGAIYGLRIAQKQWVAARQLAGDVNVFLADNNTNDITLQDYIHQTGNAAGAGRMVERWAQSMLKRLGAQTYSGEGPELTGITWDGDVTVSVAVAQNGGTGLQTPSVGSITGFDVSADGGSTWAAPSAAVITDATTITLTLAEAPAQSPLVRYQFGGPGPTPTSGQSSATRRTNAGIDNPVYDNRSPGINTTLGYPVGFTVASLAVAEEPEDEGPTESLGWQLASTMPSRRRRMGMAVGLRPFTAVAPRPRPAAPAPAEDQRNDVPQVVSVFRDLRQPPEEHGGMSKATAPAKTHDMPVQQRAAQVEPSTFNDTDGTVDVVWTTGARVRRYDWYNDTPYEEELAVDTESVDMARFDAGTVQVLDGHRTHGGVGAILGIATKASIVNGEGRATLRLSQRAEMAGVVADIKAGIIRAISFGYSVQRYEITRAQDRTDGINLPLYRAVRWQPQEISFVTVPADANAGTRAQPSNGLPCEFTPAARSEATTTTEEPTMTPEELAKIEATRAAESAAASKAAADAAAAAAATRAADITDLCTRHGVPQLAAKMIRDNSTVDQARGAVLEELARQDAARGGHQNTRIETVGDEVETRMAGIEEALHNRVDPRVKLTDAGRQYRGMSLLEIGRDYLESRGMKTRGMERMALASQMLQFRSPGMHTTSDFANLLANVANKRLRSGYEAADSTYQMWARRAPNAPDFKAMTVVQLGAAPDLLQTNEHGEFKYGSVTDGKETYSMTTYGRIVSFSRQSIVNDDLRGFDRLVGAFGDSAARLENRTVYAILTANANLADGGALFNATAQTTVGGHANLTSGAGSAMQASALATARTSMRLKKGLQNEELNVAPAFLIGPAALEETMYQLTSPDYVPATQGAISEFRRGGRTALEPIVESLLDANSATAWYLAANSASIDTVEYCYLDGAEGPVMESEIGFDVDGISYKCRLDFAAKAIDFRGLHKSAGA